MDRSGSDPVVHLEPNAVAYFGSVMVLEEAARVPAHLELLRPQLYRRTDYLHHGRHLVEAVAQERERGRQHETDFHHGIPAHDVAVQPLHHIYVIVRAFRRWEGKPLHVLGLYLELLLLQLVDPSMNEFHFVHLSGD